MLDSFELVPIGPDWMGALAEQDHGKPARGTRVYRDPGTPLERWHWASARKDLKSRRAWERRR